MGPCPGRLLLSRLVFGIPVACIVFFFVSGGDGCVSFSESDSDGSSCMFALAPM